MSGHTQGWRLSAGNPHQVFDGGNCTLANVPCGGMSGRTFAEAEDCARLIAASPDLLALAYQYRSDLLYSFAPDSRERRLAAINALIAKATGA